MYYYRCPNCGDLVEMEDYKYCPNCHENLQGYWDDPYCYDCGTQLSWNKRNGWYCDECGCYPEDVIFEDMEDDEG